ncbi:MULTISPECIES: hypothetical protein [Kamptonema]|uniref:hypothetical protein n=1 Tax=Kamptonema TaxID=1501433 RepID=UPI0001DAC63D|nr:MULTISPECIES: hypothetical protein [Kamptonema]CBN53776.1 hypothetical protein OSCI_240004 [Kamptonema sp. PCC 6506]
MKNGTISLYAFHLARTFNDPPDLASEEKAKSFGKEVQDRLTQQIGPNELTTLLLHDTYFTDLTFFYSETDLTPEKIAAFLPQNINASIGQTIFICDEVTHETEANRDSADSYVRNFLKNTEYENDKITTSDGSNLLGIPLFEYFCQSTAEKAPVCHILVLLNYQDKNEILKKLTEHYEDIVDLLCSYHKIKFVYQQAEVSYQDALTVSQQIEQKITEFVGYVADKNNNLDKFSNMLDELPSLALKHSIYCGELESYVTTIEINHQNYKTFLQKLLSAGSKLDSWQKFSDRTGDTLIKQIQCWLNYMSPRKELAQQLTASIRGIVEIEQAKSDRELENTIQAVGTGIGVGIGFAGILASSYELIEKPWDFPSPQHPLLWPHPFIIAITVSCLFGGGLGWLAWRITTGKMLKASSSTNQIRGSVQTSLSSSQSPEVAISQQPEQVRSLTSDDTKIT